MAKITLKIVLFSPVQIEKRSKPGPLNVGNVEKGILHRMILNLYSATLKEAIVVLGAGYFYTVNLQL